MELEQPIPSCFDDALDGLEPSTKHSSGAAAAAAPPSPTACFDCSICLDFAVDPVVTLCGHLYCWPCIYKWLQVNTAAPHHCPVCKAPLSLNTLVPLYGRGSLTANTPKACQYRSVNIPNRPPVLRNMIASVIEDHRPASLPNDEHAGLHPSMQHQPLHHHHHHHYHYPSPWTTSVLNSTVGGLALAILPLVSRNRDDRGSMQLSRMPSFAAVGHSLRERRQELQVESWLHQIWMFLLCCAVLCLLLF